MHLLLNKTLLTPLCLFIFLSIASIAAQAQTKIYRGAIGNSHFQMKLDFRGSEVSGTYAYDSVGEQIKLIGSLDAQGRLELKEFAKGKQPTGKFVCKQRLDNPVDPDCSWSRADGTRESLVTLEEQHIDLPGTMQITPALMNNRRTGVGVSYPQIFTKSLPNAGVQNFNRRVLAIVKKAVGEFEPIDGKGSFDGNYNVLWAKPDLISVELTVYYDGGGAHPNNYFLSLTYDLAAGKELKFEDLFSADSGYDAAIAKYVTEDIARRADELEKENARRDGRAPKLREDPIVSMESLGELSGWAMTPKGILVYFDFPHVMAYFDKTFVPYEAVKQYLNPKGPAANFK